MYTLTTVTSNNYNTADNHTNREGHLHIVGLSFCMSYTLDVIHMKQLAETPAY